MTAALAEMGAHAQSWKLTSSNAHVLQDSLDRSAQMVRKK